jgi:hypothetical protein
MAKKYNKARGSGEKGPKQRRVPISSAVKDEVVRRCGRRCCMCYVLNGVTDEVPGQFAHLDRDNANALPDNIAYLCQDCHRKYDQKSNRTSGYTPEEVKDYRERLYFAICRDPIEYIVSLSLTSEQHEKHEQKIRHALEQLKKSFEHGRIEIKYGKRG